MWIKTEKMLLNSQRCSLFYEDESGTNAVCDREEIFISEHLILSDIMLALQTNVKFLEVE